VSYPQCTAEAEPQNIQAAAELDFTLPVIPEVEKIPWLSEAKRGKFSFQISWFFSKSYIFV